ncbi:MAG: DUF1727 domain-containing protein [Candidatus Levybacteria bacterium]|nr:DUF1727 domain-containing protein [Candidatus Levybacteria bacterium]
MNILLVLFGKLLSTISRFFNLGSGSTWPGHLALLINKNFIKDLLKNSKIKVILVTGTNGKTTTGKLIQTVLEKSGKKVFQNASGANLLNGIASSLLLHSSILDKINYDYAIFEIDENILPFILKEITPDYLILLNLFRDQLDRYGEVNTITKKWQKALSKLSKNTTLILNADDPQIASLRRHLEGVNIKFFGIDSKNNTEKTQHASDSIYCPNCGEKLTYISTYFSHLGDWICKKCHNKHPQETFTSSPFYPLSGVYNQYNTNAAVLLAQALGFDKEKITASLKGFKPAFGRQEILDIEGKKAQIFLSKNPTSFNESLRTIASLNAKTILIVLNDRIPDGRDVSWIWDVEFENYVDSFEHIIISGERCYDMALRIKYANSLKNQKIAIGQFNNLTIEDDLRKTIKISLSKIDTKQTLYILPTYSAMLEVRKILTNKKIL